MNTLTSVKTPSPNTATFRGPRAESFDVRIRGDTVHPYWGDTKSPSSRAWLSRTPLAPPAGHPVPPTPSPLTSAQERNRASPAGFQAVPAREPPHVSLLPGPSAFAAKRDGPFSSPRLSPPCRRWAPWSRFNTKWNASARDSGNGLILWLAPPLPGGGSFRIAVLTEVVSQQGKEIIKTVLPRFLQEAATLKIHIDKIAKAGRFRADFVTRVGSQQPGAVETSRLAPPQAGLAGVCWSLGTRGSKGRREWGTRDSERTQPWGFQPRQALHQDGEEVAPGGGGAPLSQAASPPQALCVPGRRVGETNIRVSCRQASQC